MSQDYYTVTEKFRCIVTSYEGATGTGSTLEQAARDMHAYEERACRIVGSEVYDRKDFQIIHEPPPPPPPPPPLTDFGCIWWGELDWQTVQDVQYMSWDKLLWTFVAAATDGKFGKIKYGTLTWSGDWDRIDYLDWSGEMWSLQVNLSNKTFSIIKYGTLDWLHNQRYVHFLGWSGPGNNAWTNRKCTIEVR